MTDTQSLVQQMYKDERGDPILLSPGQDVIFAGIAKKLFHRMHIMCHTRFGKSMTVGLAVETRASTYPEKWGIVAGTKEKSKIIMDYVISHIFDNDWTASRFVVEPGDNLDEIRRYRNKNHITFKLGNKLITRGPGLYEKVALYGEVFVGSAKEVLGFGAPNVVEDEAALINNADHSFVVRMLGDHPEDNYFFKIGNPFERNHFLDSYHDPKFKKVIIDCYRSLKEGRITQEVIDENKPYPFFKILYECKFPSATEVDESGWMYLLTDTDIVVAKSRKNEPVGVRRLGIDVQRGGRNFNVWTLRTNNYAKVLKKTIESNLIPALEDTVNIMRDEGIDPKNVYVDDTGVGGGLTDMLAMRGIIVNAVKLGESAVDEEEVSNVRSQCYAGKEGLMSWIKQTGQLEDHPDWIELTRVRYKKNLSGKTVIEPKDDMRKRGIESPDVADSLALTFAKVKNIQYHGINVASILSSGGTSPYGGVDWDM